jgi:DNA-binding NtrC family response regulator
VLVVARDAAADELAAATTAAHGSVSLARDLLEACAIAPEVRPALALVDAAAAGASFVELVGELRRGGCMVALVIAEPSGESITAATLAGVDALLVRPIAVAQLRRLLCATLEVGSRRPGSELAAVIGSSPPMREVWRLVTLAAASDASVVVSGETGVGKEIVARALHRLSARRDGPFVAVNCAALSEPLLESELFGHEKGAFTGAAAQHKGRFEVAHEGTLFLDEIGDLPLGVQVKLLRVLQERCFERVGGTSSVDVNVRIIAATHHDLARAVEEGWFRADLFYRLQVITVHVPPLRDRHGDLLALWRHLLDDAAARAGGPPPNTSEAVERVLLGHDWPGNVRELANVAEHAVVVSAGDCIEPSDLPTYLTTPKRARALPKLYGFTLEELERRAILDSYQATGSVQRAAEALGISARTIHYRLKEYRHPSTDLGTSNMALKPET